ncbi:MFS transporter [Eubacterium barkeri]|uniref:Predicted arabinose efflux permease, MFS family n=1 Tax=Eubacterium barkeri TaxID=1528 RepID=A0A1H3EXK8_EUBBA|nr:MFS transporter [Eubacterium barkeri]SDX83247.1 Predicted arabinose efflux permease, MFS family [Eubacterium barkeri]
MSKKNQELMYIICLTGFITITFAFGRYIFSMITPDIVASLHIDYEFVGRINACHQAAYLLFSLLGGIFCSYLSVRFLISSSVILCGVSVFALAFVNNPWVLLVVVTFQGIFAAVSWIPMVEFVAENIEEDHRGKALGIISSGTSFGLILNGLLIPPILSQGTWQGVWFIFGIISLALGAMGVFWIYRMGGKQTEPVVEVTKTAESVDDEEKGYVYGSSGHYLKYYIVLVALLVLSGLYLIPFQSYIVPLMQEDLGLSEQISGLAWSIFGFIGIFSGFIAGVLADRYSAKAAMIMTYGISILSIAAVVFFHTGLAALLACAIFGLTYNGIFGLHPTYVSRVLPPEKTAKFFGLLNLSLGVGSMIGNYVGGYIQSQTGSFSLSYQLMLVMAVLAVLICVFIKSDRQRDKPGLMGD